MQFILKFYFKFLFQIDDFFALKKIVDSGADIAIVGGGFLGSELACALAHRANERKQNGKPGGKITQLIPDGGKFLFDKYILNFL